MTDESLHARYRSPAQIRTGGAIGNIFDGPQVVIHGLRTLLLAWPGTGFQTESVHLTVVEPGQSTSSTGPPTVGGAVVDGETGDDTADRAPATYTYDLAEEALLCRHGEVQVWLRDSWVTLRAGDIAYFPAGVAHAIRNVSDRTAYLVNQICPPQFDLYADAGLYNPTWGVMDEQAMAKAKLNSTRIDVDELDEMTWRDDQGAVRAQNLATAEVAARGALFNVLEGSAFSGIGLPMRLVLWPGAGTRMVGFNYAYCGPGVTDTIHTHPVSDEFLVMWSGAGQFYVGDLGWVDAAAGDVALAPCGVMHGHRSTDERGPSMMGGFASPPQLDLVIPTDYYDDGRFEHPQPSRLTGIPDSSA